MASLESKQPEMTMVLDMLTVTYGIARSIFLEKVNYASQCKEAGLGRAALVVEYGRILDILRADEVADPERHLKMLQADGSHDPEFLYRIVNVAYGDGVLWNSLDRGEIAALLGIIFSVNTFEAFDIPACSSLRHDCTTELSWDEFNLQISKSPWRARSWFLHSLCWYLTGIGAPVDVVNACVPSIEAFARRLHQFRALMKKCASSDPRPGRHTYEHEREYHGDVTEAFIHCGRYFIFCKVEPYSCLDTHVPLRADEGNGSVLQLYTKSEMPLWMLNMVLCGAKANLASFMDERDFYKNESSLRSLMTTLSRGMVRKLSELCADQEVIPCEKLVDAGNALSCWEFRKVQPHRFCLDGEFRKLVFRATEKDVSARNGSECNKLYMDACTFCFRLFQCRVLFYVGHVGRKFRYFGERYDIPHRYVAIHCRDNVWVTVNVMHTGLTAAELKCASDEWICAHVKSPTMHKSMGRKRRGKRGKQRKRRGHEIACDAPCSFTQAELTYFEEVARCIGEYDEVTGEPLFSDSD